MRKAAEQWRRHVDAWRGSGLSQAAYCREHELSSQSFSRWTRKHPPHAGHEAVNFVPVAVSAPAAEMPNPADFSQVNPSAVVTLRLHGAELVLSTAVQPSWLAELLRCLA